MRKRRHAKLPCYAMRKEGYKYKYGRVLSCVPVSKKEVGLEQGFLHTSKCQTKGGNSVNETTDLRQKLYPDL